MNHIIFYIYISIRLTAGVSVFERINQLLFCTKYDSIEYATLRGNDNPEISQYGAGGCDLINIFFINNV